MGTRNLTCVVIDKKFVVAQYCQWDGYPEGQGKTIVNFIASRMEPKTFKANLRALKQISNAQVNARIKKATGIDLKKKGGWVNLEEGEKIRQACPQFDRDMGAEVLMAIQTGDVKEVRLDLGFAQDSLFCEWAYVIDMDKRVLEVYRGFNTSPVPKTNRFYVANAKGEKAHSGHEYHAIALKKKYPFAKVKDLLKDAKKWNKESEDY